MDKGQLHYSASTNKKKCSMNLCDIQPPILLISPKAEKYQGFSYYSTMVMLYSFNDMKINKYDYHSVY